MIDHLYLAYLESDISPLFGLLVCFTTTVHPIYVSRCYVRCCVSSKSTKKEKKEGSSRHIPSSGCESEALHLTAMTDRKQRFTEQNKSLVIKMVVKCALLCHLQLWRCTLTSISRDMWRPQLSCLLHTWRKCNLLNNFQISLCLERVPRQHWDWKSGVIAACYNFYCQMLCSSVATELSTGLSQKIVFWLMRNVEPRTCHGHPSDRCLHR